MLGRKLSELSFEMGPIRPPSEGGSYSLLLRVTRNCPWNRCTFCASYKGEKFQLRSVDEVKGDIDAVKAIAEEIKALSWMQGSGGNISEDLGMAIIRSEPRLNTNYCFVNVFNWLASGGRTAFLQDANTPIMKTPGLVEVIRYLRDTLPGIERITSYARAKTLAKKGLEEWKELRSAGLSRLHVGLESGDDEVLAHVEKGVTAEEHIKAGRNAIEAGFELSEYVMPGLGGKARTVQHARNTALILSSINPHYIRMRPLVPRIGTPLFEEYQRGELELLSPHGYLREIETTVEDLNISGRICFDHFLNPSLRVMEGVVHLFKQDYEGYKFPEERGEVLKLIEYGLDVDEAKFIHMEELIRLPYI